MAISATWPAALKEFVAGTKLLASDLNTYVSNALSYLYTYGGNQGTSFPASPVANQKFYRTDFRAWFAYDGSAWQQISIGSFASGNPASPVTNLRIYRTDLAQILYYNGSTWVVIGGTLASLSPMTTRGDLITRDASAPTRLAVGAAGRYLRSDGTDPSWAVPLFGDLTYSGLTAGNVLRATGPTAAAFGAIQATDLPTATSAALGAIKVGNDLAISSGVLNINKGTSFPGSPVAGDLFRRTDLGVNGVTFGYTGSAWLPVDGGPLFSVNKNGTDQTGVSGTAGVDTKLTFSNAVFNIGSTFNTSNSRFTPTIAGYYVLIISVYFSTMSDQVTYGTRLYKNGSIGRYSGAAKSSGTTGHGITGTYIEYFNGSTDYAEAYCLQESGSTRTVLGDVNLTYFAGARIG